MASEYKMNIAFILRIKIMEIKNLVITFLIDTHFNFISHLKYHDHEQTF